MNPQLATRLRHLRLSGMVEALPGRARASAKPRRLAPSRLPRAARRGRARAPRRPALRPPPETGRHRPASRTLADFDWTFNPKLPEGAARRIGHGALRAHARRRPADRPARRRQDAHRHGHRDRRHPRRPPRRRPQHLRSRGQDFAEAEATGQRRDLVQQLTRVDLLVLEDFGMKKLGPQRGGRPARGLRPPSRNRVHPDHHEPPDAGLGRLPRRRAGGHRDPGPLPRATEILQTARARATACTSGQPGDRRLSAPWTLPPPWTRRRAHRGLENHSRGFPHRPPRSSCQVLKNGTRAKRACARVT